jgi:hypothetical protein
MQKVPVNYEYLLVAKSTDTKVLPNRGIVYRTGTSAGRPPESATGLDLVGRDSRISKVFWRQFEATAWRRRWHQPTTIWIAHFRFTARGKSDFSTGTGSAARSNLPRAVNSISGHAT